MNTNSKNDLPAHYGLRRSNISVPSETTSEIHFDLTDKVTTSMVVEYRTGNISFERESATLLEVINYERFLNGLSGTSFEQGRKRCDFLHSHVYRQVQTENLFDVLHHQYKGERISIGPESLFHKIPTGGSP